MARSPARALALRYPVILVMAVMLAAPTAQATELASRVKAAFLFNVAKFVDWSIDEESLDICVLEDPGFTEIAERELGNKRIGTHPVVVRDTAPDDLKGCEIVYIGESLEAAAMRNVPVSLQGQPVLTVGESPNLLRTGGMMRLKQQSGKLRFEVAVAPLEASGLRMSSKLLRLADIVPATAPSP